MRRNNTLQIKVYVTAEESIILDLLAKKQNKSKGKVLSELLNESPTWREKMQNFDNTLNNI